MAASGKVKFRSSMPDWWKWVVLPATFYMSFVVNGYAYCFGLLKIQLHHEYPDKSAQSIAIIGGLVPAFYLFLAPFGIASLEFFGCRAVTVVGSLMSGACFLVVWLNGIYLHLGFILDLAMLGFGQGISFALLYGPCVAVLPDYFDHSNLSFATGLTNAGASAGVIAYGFITYPLFEAYGWRGTMLMYGALSLQTIVAGLAFVKMIPVFEELPTRDDIEMVGNLEIEEENNEPATSEALIEKVETQIPDHTFFTVLKKYFDVKLIFQGPFLLLLGAAALSITGYFVPTILVPAETKDPQFDIHPLIQKNIMVFYGLCNLVSRVIVGRIGDFALKSVFCTSYAVFIGGLIISATACLVFPHFMHYGNIAFVTFVFVFATASAPIITSRSLLAINLFGKPNANASFGWFLCAQGSMQLSGYILPSMLDEATGPVFAYMFAAVVFFGAATCCALTGKLFFSERRKAIEEQTK